MSLILHINFFYFALYQWLMTLVIFSYLSTIVSFILWVSCPYFPLHWFIGILNVLWVLAICVLYTLWIFSPSCCGVCGHWNVLIFICSQICNPFQLQHYLLNKLILKSHFGHILNYMHVCSSVINLIQMCMSSFWASDPIHLFVYVCTRTTVGAIAIPYDFLVFFIIPYDLPWCLEDQVLPLYALSLREFWLFLS